MPNETRLRGEASHHDAYYLGGRIARTKVRRFYSVAKSASERYESLVEAYLSSTHRALVIGCGTGEDACWLASCGLRVIGIDLSREGIRAAEARAQRYGHGTDNPRFLVMDAENLGFRDGSFDIVIGRGILHHLSLDAAAAEVARVLRPEARAFFLEPLGHNPLINIYRRLTPSIRTVDEHPLRASDLDVLARHFGQALFEYRVLLALAAAPLANLPGFKALVGVLDRVDATLLRMPFLRRFAWQILVQLAR